MDTNIFVSKIPFKYYQSRELYELLATEIVEPAVQNITKPENYVRPFKTYRSYVSRRISKCKVKTIGMIRKKFEDGIGDHLPGRLKKFLKHQFNSLLKYMKSSLNIEGQFFAKELLKSSSPISQLAWQMLRHINAENFKYRKQSVLWNGINILINGSKGGSKELICNLDVGATAIQVKNLKDSEDSKSIVTQSKLPNHRTVDTRVNNINTINGKEQENLKDLSVCVSRLNCSNIEPLCMVHKLYKCFCKGKYLGSPPSKLVCNYTEAQNMIVEKENNTNYNTVLNKDDPNEPNSHMKKDDKVTNIDISAVNDEPSETLFTSCIVERKLIQKANESIVSSLNESKGENVNNDELRNVPESLNCMSFNGRSASESTIPSRIFSVWLLNEYYYMKRHLSCGEQFILEKPFPNQIVLFPYSDLLNKYKLAKNYFLVNTKQPHRVHITIHSTHKEFNNHIEIHCISIKDLRRHFDFVKHLLLQRHLENYFVVLQGHLNSWEVKALVSQNTENSSYNETSLAVTIDPHNPITFRLNNAKRCIAHCPLSNNLHKNYMINQQAKLTSSATKTVADSNNAVNVCQPNFECNKLNQPEALSQKYSSLDSCSNAIEEFKCALYAKDSLNSNAHEIKTDVHDNFFKWFVMLIEKDLTRLDIHKNKQFMFVKYQTIMSVIELAHSSNKNLLIPFSGTSGQSVAQFGIYVKLSIPKNYVTIGPYEKGDKYFIESFNKSNQKISTRGYWVTTQKFAKQIIKLQAQERRPKGSIYDANKINMQKANYLERNAEVKEDKNLKNKNSPIVVKTTESPVSPHNHWQTTQNIHEPVNKSTPEPLKNHVLPAGTLPNANSSTDNTKSATTQLYRIPEYPVITSVGRLLESDIKNECSPANGLYYLIQDQYDQEKHSQGTTDLQRNPQHDEKRSEQKQVLELII